MNRKAKLGANAGDHQTRRRSPERHDRTPDTDRFATATSSLGWPCKLRWACKLGGTFAAVLVTLPAFGQASTEWEVSGSAALGFTDNVAGTPEPEGGAANAPSPEADGFGLISPAVRLVIETPGSTHNFAYAFAYNFYFIQTGANNFSNALSYGFRAPVGAGTELIFAANAGQSTVAQFALATPGAAQEAEENEAADNLLVSVGLGQGLTTQLSEVWTFSQALQATMAQTVIQDGVTVVDGEEVVTGLDTRTFVGGLSFGFTREFARDRLSIDQSNDGQFSPAVVTEQGEGESNLQITNRVRATWGHDFSESVSSSLGAGVFVAYDVMAETIEPIANPNVAANLNWNHPMGTASVSFIHDATPNILLRQITLNDALTVGSNFLLPKGFDFSANVAGQFQRVLLGSDGFGPLGFMFTGSANVGWIPGEAPARIDLSYQISRQLPIEEGEGALPRNNRQAVMLSGTFAWPGQPTAGGAAPFVVAPNTSANADILAQQVPDSARAKDQEERDEKDEKSKKGSGGGDGEE